MTDAIDIHKLLSNRRHERNFSIKIKRNRDTQRLFLDTKRSVRNIRVFYSYEFIRVRCHTKNASLLYLPGDYDEPVLFNQIQCRILSLKETMKSKSTVWLVVMRKFYHEKQNYNVGDILKVQKTWVGRRFLNWMRKHSTPDEPTVKRLDTYIYPRKKCSRTPIIDLQKNCKQCDSPTLRSYMSLCEAVTTITPPYIMTIPFDPFTRSVKRNTMCNRNSRDDDTHQNNIITASNTTSYFEQVVIDGVERFDVFLTSFGGGGGDDDEEITAIAIPEHVEFNAECNTGAISNSLDILHDGAEVQLTDTDLLQVKHRLEPILLRLDNIDELTQINLKPTSSSSTAKVDGDNITADNGDGVGNRTYSQEFQMQCFMRYHARVMRSDIPSTPQATREKQAAAKNHPYYNVVPENGTNTTKIIPNISTTSWSGLSSSSNDDEHDDDYEEGIDMVSYDENGGFLMVGKTKKKKKPKGDYLSPLNSFTKGYSHFKHTASTINHESGQLPDTMVIGVEGYVQMEGGGSTTTQNANSSEDITKDTGRSKPKKNFWKQLSSNSKHKRKEGIKLPSSPKPSSTATEQRIPNKTVQINYYQPMYNIYQDKPPTPPKPPGLLASLSPRGNGKKLTKPLSPLARYPKSPGAEEKRRYLAESKARLSLKPLLQSFDYEDLSGDDLMKQYEVSISPSTTTTSDSKLPEWKKLEKTDFSRTHHRNANLSSRNARTTHTDHDTTIERPLQNVDHDEIICKYRAKPDDTTATTASMASCNEQAPKVPTKRNRYGRSSSSTKSLLASFDDTDISLNNHTNDSGGDRVGGQTANIENVDGIGNQAKTIKDNSMVRRWTMADQERIKMSQESSNTSEKPSLLKSLDENDTNDKYYSHKAKDAGEGETSAIKRTSFGNRYSAALDSRISYFETKCLVSSP